MAHIVTGDIWIKLFVEIVCALCWWIPFIGVLKQQTATALELRADYLATKALNESERLDYLDCLLKFAKANHKEASSLSMSFTSSKKSSLKNRFMCVLAPKKASPIIRTVAFLFVAVLLLSSFIVLEPYALPDDVLASTFAISADATFLVPRSDQGYDLYINGDYVSEIAHIPHEFSEFPIIENMKEAE